MQFCDRPISDASFRKCTLKISHTSDGFVFMSSRSEDSENVQVSGLNVRCQRRSRERCKQQSKDCLVKVEGNYWGDV